ncbi:hypothetical protein [Armatimonas sp.]|uniref:hypothetical protein n=1 Tax=Armatimonas sp. TaxID=1872638 RepID=UPI00286CCA9C|nr:hypothetical protein [Armatimonas sp.]
MRRFSWLCFALVALLLTGLALHPKTGWLVRQQAQAAFGGQGVALIQSLEGPKTPPKLSEAGEVARQLRKLCEEKLKLRRDDEESFLDPRHRASTTTTISTEFSLYEVLELTKQGTQCDPNNAFFPALRAVALLSTRSDEQALIALHQAAQCPRWEDYTREEILAWLDQLEQVQGKHSALADVQVTNSLILPHFSQLRTLTRIVTVLAAKKELAGDLAAGLVIRHDLRALGERIREQGNCATSTRCGSAITQIAATRPGGGLPKTYTGTSEEKNRTRCHDQLMAHRKLWGTEEAVALEKVFARNDTVMAELGKRSYPSDNHFPLVGQWQASLFLLGDLLATVLLGAFFALLAKLSRGKSARPGTRFGLWLALGVAPLLAWRAGLGDDQVWLEKGSLVTSWLVGLFAIWQVWRSTERGKRWQEAGLALAALVGVGQVLLIGVLAIWGTQETVQAYVGRFVLCEGCLSQAESDPIPWWKVLWDDVSYRVFFALPTLAPLLALAPVLALISRVKRVPVSFGVARGLGRCALPVALVLTLVYAWQVHATATQEARLRVEFRACVEDDRAFFGEK